LFDNTVRVHWLAVGADGISTRGRVSAATRDFIVARVLIKLKPARLSDGGFYQGIKMKLQQDIPVMGFPVCRLQRTGGCFGNLAVVQQIGQVLTGR
jgi:ABC-type phosphate transport system auxiliary subunit